MIYSIVSKNEVPISQMHIYLKNKTGEDGGNIPELFNGLSSKESINSLYAFATGCVLTGDFTNMDFIKKGFPTIEVGILALIQYLKGMATTIQLNLKCVSPLYLNLVNSGLLGISPTLLNLDGDLFGKPHYDSDKYFNKESADEAEDSFPYWVINTVKEIKESNELITPKKNVIYEVPYFIQNISSERIPIYDSLDKTTRSVIGYIPPTGVEAIGELHNGNAKLLSALNAWIELNDKNIIPIQHIESLDELSGDIGTLILPQTPFKIKIKNECSCNAGYGINAHYLSDEEHEYESGDIITIDSVYLNSYGIIDEKYFIGLNSMFVYIVNSEIEESSKMEHTKNNDAQLDTELMENLKNSYILGTGVPTAIINYMNEYTGNISSDDIGEQYSYTARSNDDIITEKEIQLYRDCKYIVVIPCRSFENAFNISTLLSQKTEYEYYVDVHNSNYNIIVTGSDDDTELNKVKKKIISATGAKAKITTWDNI